MLTVHEHKCLPAKESCARTKGAFEVKAITNASHTMTRLQWPVSAEVASLTQLWAQSQNGLQRELPKPPQKEGTVLCDEIIDRL